MILQIICRNSQLEAIWVVSNMIEQGNTLHIEVLVTRYAIIQALCSAMSMLVRADIKTMELILNVLKNILQAGGDDSTYVNQFTLAGGFKMIEEIDSEAALDDLKSEILEYRSKFPSSASSNGTKRSRIG